MLCLLGTGTPRQPALPSHESPSASMFPEQAQERSTAGSTPDKQGPFQDNGGHVGGCSISGQNCPEEEHCSQVVHIGGGLVGTHLQNHSKLIILLASWLNLTFWAKRFPGIQTKRESIIDSKGRLACQKAYRKVEAHDDEGQHQLVSNARPQELVVHDVAPHAILHPWAIMRYMLWLTACHMQLCRWGRSKAKASKVWKNSIIVFRLQKLAVCWQLTTKRASQAQGTVQLLSMNTEASGRLFGVNLQ